VATTGQSQTTRALIRLRELLLAGEFAPGQRLSELPLVDRLGVSRTPLRMALAQLEHEGLLEARETGGYVARAFTRADAEDAIELRGVLEGTAARLAAERGVDADALAALRAQAHEMEDVIHGGRDLDSFVTYSALNEEFHKTLVAAARSPVVERAIERAVSLPFASPSATVGVQAQIAESQEIMLVALSHHRVMLDSIERGQGARAEAIAREHARLGWRNLDIALTKGPHHVPGASLIRTAVAEA
jgi:GntR family transcriptional regulator, vanillate catabolism transcriptional regulator